MSLSQDVPYPSMIPHLRPDQIERLSLLIEECSEVIGAATKVLRHGYGSYNPDNKDSFDNQYDLAKELGHLENAVAMMTRQGDVSLAVIEEERKHKSATIKRWLHHQRS